MKADKVIKFFKEFSKIPHESFKEKAVSDYLVAFAKERGLFVVQDELYNVIIKKPSNIPGFKGDAVIFQGHMDMVYVTDPNQFHDYESGIEVVEKDGFLCSKDNASTLGADNGIAVAMCMALLDSDDIKHPDLEVILTVQEETGLTGAEAVNVSDIKGKYFINLDSEEEGVFYTSCAGGIRSKILIDAEKEAVSGLSHIAIDISGLKGGHSGMEIHMERGNGIKLLGRLLNEINSDELHLCKIHAPGKANAISSKAQAIIGVEANSVSAVMAKINEMADILKKELQFSDDLVIAAQKTEFEATAYTQNVKNKIITTLMLMPTGVFSRSLVMEDLVQTSSNIGSLEEIDGSLELLVSIRSSVGSQKYYLVEVIKNICAVNGLSCDFSSDYPQWEYRTESALRTRAMNLFRDMFGKEPHTAAIHAGLECGYFDQKLPGIDLISFGPNQYDVHTPKERVSIESIDHMWEFMVRLVEELAN